MRKIIRSLNFAIMPALVLAVGIATCQAQEPQSQGPGDRPRRGGRSQSAPTVESIVTRMMAFDANHDGKLTRDEIADPRLMRVFERADTNHDGVVTRDELTALAKKIIAEMGTSRGGGPGGFGGPGGPDDFGPPGGFGGGGFGGGGFGGGGPRPPRPGQLLPPHIEDSLELTAEQKTQLAALQKEVNAKMAEILTDKQKDTLKSMEPPE